MDLILSFFRINVVTVDNSSRPIRVGISIVDYFWPLCLQATMAALIADPQAPQVNI